MVDQGAQGLLSPRLQRARLSAALPLIDGSVLDFGCGSGALAEFVGSSKYLGIDRNMVMIELAKQRYPEHSFASEIPEGHLFDTIVALAVLEHLPAAGACLHLWSRHLAPKGCIVVTTPHRCFRKLHDYGSRVGLFSKEAADEHEELFDRASLTELAIAAGLNIRDYRRFLFGANQLCVFVKTTAGAGT